MRPVSNLINTPNFFSVAVAAPAGIVGIVSLTEARTSALLGVFISVTTIPAGMRALGEVCGTTLARAHARSGDRIAIAAYLGRGHAFDRALTYFAEKYADQNERDHRALVDAIRAGRFPSAGNPEASGGMTCTHIGEPPWPL